MPSNFRHYVKLDEQLRKNVDDATRNKIFDNMDYIKQSSEPEIKTEWAREITNRMDGLLDTEMCRHVRENCACLVSNEGSIYAKTFRKLRKQFSNDNDYLIEVIKYLNNTTPLRRCGDVRREGDKILSTIGIDSCGCPTIGKGLKGTISATWCHCCKGSLLSVYRYVFDKKDCVMQIIETVASGGKTCTFSTEYVDRKAVDFF